MHVKILTTTATVAALALGLLFGGVDTAQAQEAMPREEITLTPASAKHTIVAGQATSGSFSVVNTGETTFSFTVYARPYSVETKAYNPNYSEVGERSNAYRWIQFDITKGRLAPGKSQEINYTILVPEGTPSGGHYSVLFAETVADESDQQVIVRNKRVGTVLRLTAEGDIRREGAVESIAIPWLQFRAPLSTSAEVTNSGNVDFDAESHIRISNIFGKQLYETERSSVVFPDRPRSIKMTWDQSPWVGLYKVEQTTTVLGEAKTASSYVLLMPRWLVFLLVMIVVSGGIYAAYRRVH